MLINLWPYLPISVSFQFEPLSAAGLALVARDRRILAALGNLVRTAAAVSGLGAPVEFERPPKIQFILRAGRRRVGRFPFTLLHRLSDGAGIVGFVIVAHFTSSSPLVRRSGTNP